jgi:hypothetical protein
MTKRKITKVLNLVVSVLLLLIGGRIVYVGFNQPPEPTPQVEKPIKASPTQEPTGPVETDDGFGPDDMAPNHLLIPALNIYSPINNDGDTGQTKNGQLVLSPPETVTRWVDGANVQSEEGSLLLAGHVSYNGTRGAIYHLAEIKAGNVAYVTDDKGNWQEFQLDTLETINKSALPKEVFATSGEKRLNIVTCGGRLLKRGRSYTYESNIIASFKVVE